MQAYYSALHELLQGCHYVLKLHILHDVRGN